MLYPISILQFSGYNQGLPDGFLPPALILARDFIKKSGWPGFCSLGFHFKQLLCQAACCETREKTWCQWSTGGGLQLSSKNDRKLTHPCFLTANPPCCGSYMPRGVQSIIKIQVISWMSFQYLKMITLLVQEFLAFLKMRSPNLTSSCFIWQSCGGQEQWLV